MRKTHLPLCSAFVAFLFVGSSSACGDSSTSAGGAASTGGPSSSSGATTSSANSATSTTTTSASGTTASTGGFPSTRVFVTSKTYMGNFGGIAGGDAECQSLAVAAGLGGTWKAWLGQMNGMGPSSRFVLSPLPYVLVGGGEIASNWTDLTDGTLAVPIDHDETGTAIVDPSVTTVWTGSSNSGEALSPCCADWTDANDGSAAGSTKRVDMGWSFTGGQTCTTLARIYCFEQ